MGGDGPVHHDQPDPDLSGLDFPVAPARTRLLVLLLLRGQMGPLISLLALGFGLLLCGQRGLVHGHCVGVYCFGLHALLLLSLLWLYLVI